jgi:hypothetical protein
MPELKDIVSISGKSGLYQIIGKRSNGLIVESLDESKRRFPTSLTQKISILEDISIYTYDSDVKLSEVFKILHSKVKEGLELVDKNTPNEGVKAFFRSILSDFDEERVYVSDMVKVAQWYSLLKDQMSFEETPKKEADTKEDEPKKAAKKPAKKKAAKPE